MDFIETDELQMLREAVGSIASKFGHEYYVQKARADERTEELWNAVAEAGRAGLAESAGRPDQADDHYRSALAVLDRTDLPLARVRALIDYGAFLRRAGRPRQSREPLRRAVSEARACGAERLMVSAMAELHASGGRRPRGNPTQLSPRERHVADLAAGGLTNAEIAAALIISIRTVEHHLQAVYTKLGVHSRRELSRDEVTFRSLRG